MEKNTRQNLGGCIMPSGVNFSFAWKSDTNSNQRNSKNTNSKSSNGQTRRTTPNWTNVKYLDTK